MTESFREYYEAFKDLRSEAAAIIRLIPDAPVDRRMALERDARERIEEVERYVRILGQEALGGDAQMKRKMQTQLHSCKSDLEKLHNNLEKALLVGAAHERSTGTTTVTVQDRLDRTGAVLNDAITTIEETRGVAIRVGENLATQGDQLRRAQVNVHATRVDVQEAALHLKSLKRKNNVKMVFLWLIIFLLVGGIVYWFVDKIQNVWGVIKPQT